MIDEDWRMDYDNADLDFLCRRMAGSSSPSRSSLPISSSPSIASLAGGNYIIHRVSKLDTLAGVAIKYGVEVADIKRLNGLVTDLQMFALRTLQIPLPGRHPPSLSLYDDHETPQRPSSSGQNLSNHWHSDPFGSFQSPRLKSSPERKVSPAMTNLQGYYGLKQSDLKSSRECCEIVGHHNGLAHIQDGLFPLASSHSNPPLSHYRKSKSVANGLTSANGAVLDPLLSQQSEDSAGRWIERLLKRRQSESDFTSCPTEMLLKEESSSGSAVSAITGQTLALRPKAAARTVAGGVDSESGGVLPSGSGESFPTENIGGVRKSSSTSSLQEPENGPLSLIWPSSKWTLNDFPVISSSGIPKPISKRNKAAID